MSFFDDITRDRDERSTDETDELEDHTVEVWIMTHDLDPTTTATETYRSIEAEIVVDGMVAPISSTTIDEYVATESAPEPLTDEEFAELDRRRRELECVDVSDFQLEDEEHYEHEAIEVVEQADPGDPARVIFRHPEPGREEEWLSADRSAIVDLQT